MQTIGYVQVRNEMMQNLHRIFGAQYLHEKAGLCERCKHRTWFDNRGWYYGNDHYCVAKSKVLSGIDDRVKKPRCSDFESKDDSQT